ncbi:MAG: hypothetical protein AAGC60_07700 [Acidobacteriota bacterium]
MLGRSPHLVLLCLTILCAASAAGGITLVNDPDHPNAIAAAGAKSADVADPLAALDPLEAITEIYQRFEDASSASGQEIRFEIDGVTTYRNGQFDELIWTDLFTAPGGWTLETVPHIRLRDLPSQEQISFVSHWDDQDDTEWSAQDFLKRTTLLRADEAVTRLGAWDTDRFDGVRGLTTFAVTISFAERARSYSGLVLWAPLDDETVLFSLVDHVAPGVDLAFHEQRAFVTRDQLEVRPDSEVPAPWKALTCLNWPPFDQYDPTIGTGALTIGHSSGSHSASLRAARYCSQSNCTSFCSPYSAFKACNEAGSISNPLYWHKKANSVAIDSVNGFGETRSECGYGWGCAVKSCLFGVCGGITFGASGRGASLKVNATSGVLSDMSISKGGFCPAAGVDFEPPCSGLVGEVATLSLSEGAVKVDLPAADFKLTRLEASDVVHHGEPVSYLMAEWALLSYQAPQGKAPARTAAIATSHPDFAQAKRAELEVALGAGTAAKAAPGDHLTLVVGLPQHEANSRKIAMPDLRVATDRVPGGSAARKVLVRADFGEDRELQGLQILHDSLGGVPHELALHIERSLSLEAASDEQHRVIVFALLEVGQTLELEAAIPYLPKCCCGAYFCA